MHRRQKAAVGGTPSVQPLDDADGFCMNSRLPSRHEFLRTLNSATRFGQQMLPYLYTYLSPTICGLTGRCPRLSLCNTRLTGAWSHPFLKAEKLKIPEKCRIFYPHVVWCWWVAGFGLVVAGFAWGRVRPKLRVAQCFTYAYAHPVLWSPSPAMTHSFHYLRLVLRLLRVGHARMQNY